MATIGTFTKKDETYQGTITTLTLKAKVNITPVARENDKAPDFRVYAGSAEIGAAWSTTATNGNPLPPGKPGHPRFRGSDLPPPGRERRIPRPRLVPLIQPAPAQAGAFFITGSPPPNRRPRASSNPAPASRSRRAGLPNHESQGLITRFEADNSWHLRHPIMEG